jgi:hypothetical protein
VKEMATPMSELRPLLPSSIACRVMRAGKVKEIVDTSKPICDDRVVSASPCTAYTKATLCFLVKVNQSIFFSHRSHRTRGLSCRRERSTMIQSATQSEPTIKLFPASWEICLLSCRFVLLPREALRLCLQPPTIMSAPAQQTQGDAPSVPTHRFARFNP